MPCPLFLPAHPLPLSDIYDGTCSAEPEMPLTREMLTRACNPGHARSLCVHAAAAQADSLRFLVRSDDGRFVEVAWAEERNHHPVAVGTLQVARTDFVAATPLEHQARACAAGYLRQTGAL